MGAHVVGVYIKRTQEAILLYKTLLMACFTNALLMRRLLQVKLLEARPQDGFGTSGQPSAALLTWPQEPNNSLYYSRDAVPYSDKELAMQVQVSINNRGLKRLVHKADDSISTTQNQRVCKKYELQYTSHTSMNSKLSLINIC